MKPSLQCLLDLTRSYSHFIMHLTESWYLSAYSASFWTPLCTLVRFIAALCKVFVLLVKHPVSCKADKSFFSHNHCYIT